MSRLKGTRLTYADRLDSREKEKIILWSRRRMPQVEMARRLGASVDTIRRQQKRMDCAVEYRRPIDEQARREILALRDQGLSSRSIALRTGVGVRTVLRVLGENGITIKARRPLSPEKVAAIDADIRGRRDFLCRIAKKYHVGVETVRRRKKKVLGNAPLKSTWPPLQSKFSQTDAAEYVPTPEEFFLALVRKCIDLAADKFLLQGRDRADIITAKQYLKNNPTPILEKFEAGLRDAVAAWRLEQMTAGSMVH